MLKWAMCIVVVAGFVHVHLDAPLQSVRHAEEALQMNTTVGLIGPVDSIGSKHMPAHSVNWNLCPIICCHFLRPNELRHKMPEIYGELWALSAFHSDLCAYPFTPCRILIHDRRRDTCVYSNECQGGEEEQTQTFCIIQKCISHGYGCVFVIMLTD